MSHQRLPVLITASITGAALLAAHAWAAVDAGQAASVAPAAFAGRLGAVSIPFVENAGQIDARVRFYAPTFAGTLFVTDEGALVYSLPGRSSVAESDAPPGPQDPLPRRKGDPVPPRAPGWTLVESFVGGHPLPAAGGRSATNVSRLVGDQERHRAIIGAHDEIRLGEVYPGIAVALRAAARNVEKILTVRPGADPRQIRLRIDGAVRLATAADGSLVIATGNGEVSLTPPVAFQVLDGVRHPVAVAYALAADGLQYGFALGPYARDQPLIIDPLLQSTYLGGTGDDRIQALAVHPVSGEIIVGGLTTSIAFPGTAGGAQPAHFADDGNFDGFVARLSPDLKTLLQFTYLGSSGNDQVLALAIHPATGEIYVAGPTNSATFPGTAGGAQPAKVNDGSYDVFIARLDAGLTSLLQATYFGGGGFDTITGIAIDPASGDVFAAGYTASETLPGALGGVKPSGDTFGIDGFVVRLNRNLTQVVQSTFVGGPAFDDYLYAIAVHPLTGEVLVAGRINATGILLALNPDLKSFVRPAFGHGSIDAGTFNAIAVHPVTGDIVVGGMATATTIGTTAGGAQETHAADGGLNDGVLVRIPGKDWKSGWQATFLGGNGDDQIVALAIHPANGEILAAGYTKSTDFPGVAGGVQPVHAGASFWDGFVARLSSDLTKVRQSTFLGGGSHDEIMTIAVHPASGEVLVAGTTVSGNFPGTSGGIQPVHGADSGNLDGFVARLSPDLTSNDSTPAAFAFPSQFNVPLSSVRTAGPVQVTGITGQARIYVEGRLGSSYCVSSGPNCDCDVSLSFVSTPGAITNANYVCARHASSAALNQVTRTDVHIGGALGLFAATTGTQLGNGCTLDVDGNAAIDALTDGLILVRAMFGLTGTAVTDNAIGDGASRTTWAQIQAFLNGNCASSFAP